jgi:hypothetical protein
MDMLKAIQHRIARDIVVTSFLPHFVITMLVMLIGGAREATSLVVPDTLFSVCFVYGRISTDSEFVVMPFGSPIFCLPLSAL